MSQYAFNISHPMTSVRLLELPPELADLLTTTDPPAAPLKFKSGVATPDDPGILHLCTPTKSWAVKQVNTSNSVYVVRPGGGGVSAVAQVGSFLELHGGVVEVVGVEREVLRVVRGAGGMGWNRVVADVAAPDLVVERCMRRLGVVEVEVGGRGCVVPMTREVLRVWKGLVEGCAIEGLSLDGVVMGERVAKVLVDEVEVAVAEGMLGLGGMFDVLGLWEEREKRLRKDRLCWFVAALVLSEVKSAGMGVDEFVKMWTDLVPASFVKYCVVEDLVAMSSGFRLTTGVEGKHHIAWDGGAAEYDVNYVTAAFEKVVKKDESVKDGEATTETPKKPAAATTTGDKKRKWHEKFGAQRNVKQ